jgi:hypothetical protein
MKNNWLYLTPQYYIKKIFLKDSFIDLLSTILILNDDFIYISFKIAFIHSHKIKIELQIEDES